ncbi:MAG TPA: phosphate ABC transporter permease subunit PstC, partial [Thermoplasmata archaeon]
PPAVREPLGYLVELLAAVPSVVYGFWALAVIAPLLQHQVEPDLAWLTGGGFPFSGHSFGLDVLTASVVLAIMVLPTISAIARASLQAIPKVQREAALSLGATRWESTRIAVLGPARSGIIGGILLGLGRAVGETIAVALTIGNINQIPTSLFSPGQTIASLIANDFTAVAPPETNAIVEIGLVLLLVTLVINVIARLLIWRIRRETPSTSHPRRSTGGRLRALAERASAATLHPLAVGTPGAERPKPAPAMPAWRRAARDSAGPRRARRRAVYWTAVGLMLIATVLAVAPLVSILWTAADRGGAAVVQPSFYTTEPTPACNPGPNVSCSLGGIGPYIVGTLVLLGIAGLIAIPVGILAGIYLSEYGRNRYGRTVSFFTDVMTGLPSILLGVFVFVVFLQYDRDIANSAISGGVALSVLMIPLVTRTTEEALKTVPMSLRESALALGFPKHRVTLRITLGCARNAIVTGTLLATARAGGETAALLMTATGFEYWPHGLGQR